MGRLSRRRVRWRRSGRRLVRGRGWRFGCRCVCCRRGRGGCRQCRRCRRRRWRLPAGILWAERCRCSILLRSGARIKTRISESSGLSRSVTEVHYFHEAFILTDLIVDQHGTMQQLTNPRPFPERTPHARKTRQQIHMVEQSGGKTRHRLGAIFGNVADDFGEGV